MTRAGWEPGSSGRIRERIEAAGEASLVQFLRGRPTSTFREIADEIGGVAPVQVIWQVIAECGARREWAWFVRDQLVRALYAEQPEGLTFPEKPTQPLAMVWVGAKARIGRSNREAFKRSRARLKALVKDRQPWLPASADDPMLLEAFGPELWAAPD